MIKTNRYSIRKKIEKSYEKVEARVERDIERYRKGDATLSVVDKNGAPVEGTEVSVRLKKHAFRFGANIFMLDELETPEKNEIYKERFKELFNLATLPFYWKATEPEEGLLRYEENSPPLYRRPPIDRCIRFCEENGIEPREHGLAYGSTKFAFPEWLREKSIDEAKALLEKRYREISERYADKIPTIEVTNESGRFTANTPFYYEDDYMPFCYKLAEKYFPNNKIAVNEDSTLSWNTHAGKWSQYYMQIEKLLAMGCRIDVIGFQYHMFNKKTPEKEFTSHFYDLEHLLWILDTYATFGKPLEITEISIPAYTWDPEDEQLQADIIERLYKLWFSHPAMEKIIYWNLADGYAHAAEPGDMTVGENVYYGGLLRFDMSKKPAYDTIHRLINETFTTRETLTTSGAGAASFRGFYGEYEYTVTKDGVTSTGTLTLDKSGNPIEIRI